MKFKNVLMVRIYLTELSPLLKEIVHYLKLEAKVRGISVFRAISGYGEGGDHTAAFLDLSLDLPIVIEFFDDQQSVETALAHLNTRVKKEHIVVWDARVNE